VYEYSAKVVRVVDADTVWLDVDLGFDVRRKDSFRLYGINAPEMNTDAGLAAKRYLEALLIEFPMIFMTTVKDRREKYGRYLATLFVPTSEKSVNEMLIENGHAVAYYP